jgi:hypothetical protein
MLFTSQDIPLSDLLEDNKYHTEQLRYHLSQLALSFEECHYHLQKVCAHASLIKKDLHRGDSHV